LDEDDELELLEPPPPFPPPLPPPPPLDEELELELLDPVEDDDELELDGVEEDELEDDVLDVLGAELDELELLGVEEDEEPPVEFVVELPSGPVGLPFSHPMVAASPSVIAPPLRRRRKSRRSESDFPGSFASVGRSLWLAMAADMCNPAAMAGALMEKDLPSQAGPASGKNPGSGRRRWRRGQRARVQTQSSETTLSPCGPSIRACNAPAASFQ
jgi:hypothetical protein